MREAGDVIIRAKNITKLYGMNKADAVKMIKEGATKDAVYKKTGVTVALWDVSLEIKRGEIFVIIGLSGSGKSTLIRCFNMLNRPTSGQIMIGDCDLSTLSKKALLQYRREKISMVFQNFGLMSHRDVLNNVTYGLEVRGLPKDERESIGRKMTAMVGLGGLESQPITALSGGMRQRVGLARALANDPEVLLMDEPFSALDPLVRKDMQFELLSIQRKLGKTVIFITHDIDEAFKLGDTVAIMRDGKLIQVDTPAEMTANPADDYVRQFIDSADKTKVFNVKSVMLAPCMVRLKDTPTHAIREMTDSSVSTAYVVNEQMRFVGIVTIDGAISARSNGTPLADQLITGIPSVHQDTMLNDILPIAAEAKFPIAVLDEHEELKGIVTRAAVISSLT